MKVLVTGGNGQLGMCLRRIAPDFIYTDVVDVPGYETTRLDITDLEAVRTIAACEDIDAIINCAAYTNVDAAEDNEALAELLNAEAPANLATVCRERGALLIHISTDYVFGKEPYNVPCREDQKGTPTGVYGLTKLHGEKAVMASGARYVIIRTAWLYSEFGKNFVKTMLGLTAEKPSLKVVFDQVGTPTYAADLARVILSFLSNPKEGIYHYSNEGVCSWYDFTVMIAKLSGHTSCRIEPCHSNEFPSKVVRPSFSVLDKSLIKETLGIEIPYWTDSLEKCINNLI